MKSFEEIIIASNNQGKIAMIQSILDNYRVLPMSEAGVDIDVEETGETFMENARLKAETIASQLNGKACLADDSGIEVEYLDGFPGVRTKRWFDGTDRERNLALIEKMQGVEKSKRKVKFKVSMALSDGEETLTAESYIEGYVAEAPRGENGFGFDEIFELENGKTLAELTFEQKNEVSARRLALDDLLKKLKSSL